MFLSRHLPRRFSAGALCCLLFVGGLPRAWCVCPDAACRAACDAEVHQLAPPASQPATCPHCAGRDNPQNDRRGDESGLSSSQCQCVKHVAQAVLLSAGHEVQAPAASIAWIFPADREPQLRASTAQACRRPIADGPPDDPVSRAQILRL